MGVQAYILIQSEIGSSEAVVLATRAVPGVLESFEVTGPYDVIVRCEAESVDDLGKFIVGAIQKVPGIARTLTYRVVNIYPKAPSARSASWRCRSMPQLSSPSRVPEPALPGERPMPPGVLENRGAGCGCTSPSREKTPRAVL